MASLYELTTQATALYEMLQNEEIDEQTFNDTLEAMGTGEKIESYCKIIKQFQSDADMFKSEIDRLTARKQTAENAVERMKTALLEIFTADRARQSKSGHVFRVYSKNAVGKRYRRKGNTDRMVKATAANA